jgi:hypothetical protein
MDNVSRPAEANLSALIESTEDLLGSVDLDFRLRTFNGAFRRHVAGQFGARPKVGMRPKDYLPPDGAARWAPFFQRALAEGPFRVEYLLREGGTLELAFQPDFVDQVLAVVNRTGARPENLRLELTESMLSQSIEDTVAKMRELRLHWVRFSLDDFGTGYSSLAYLKQLPISRLKIDRAFVKDILVDAASRAIAQTIISLGCALDLSVIAEGVETEEQRGFLAGMGCHSYQRYLFSRPLPIEKFEKFLDEFGDKQPWGLAEFYRCCMRSV